MPPVLFNLSKPPIAHNELEAPRSIRGRKVNSSHGKHSPDGYFPPEDVVRAWQPLDIANIRNRSRTQNSQSSDSTVLQDVAEEDISDPHPWRPPLETDSRGPCPALGALCNHGYLPHDGRNIGIWQMVQALRKGYGGSWAYAFGLTIVSYTFLRLGGVGKGWICPTIDMEDLGAHGVLEHDASLAHADVREVETTAPSHEHSRSYSSTSLASSTAISAGTTYSLSSFSSLTSPPTLISLPLRVLFAVASCLPLISRFIRPRAHVYAPTRPSPRLVDELLADSASGTHFTLADAARARVRREATAPPIPSWAIQQFADGEFAMTIDILGQDGKIELDVLRTWLEEERLPPGWEPTHVQGLLRTHAVTEKVKALMEGLRKYRKKGRAVQSIACE